MTEFGNLALIDQDAGEENGVAVPLPGVRKGEHKSPALSPTHFLGGPAAPSVGLPVSPLGHFFSGTWNA